MGGEVKSKQMEPLGLRTRGKESTRERCVVLPKEAGQKETLPPTLSLKPEATLCTPIYKHSLQITKDMYLHHGDDGLSHRDTGIHQVLALTLNLRPGPPSWPSE